MNNDRYHPFKESVENILHPKEYKLLFQEFDKLKLLLEKFPIGIVIINFSQKVHWINEAACEMIGISDREETIGVSCLDHFCPPDIHECPLWGGKNGITNQECQITRKNGSKISAIKSAQTLKLDGEPLILEAIQDVSSLRDIRKQLIEANKIINKSGLVIFKWQNRQGWPVEYVTENVERLFGYRAEEFMSGRISYKECIHPDDKEQVEEEVITHSKRGDREEFEHKPYRIMTKAGEEKIIKDLTFIERTSKGEVTSYKGIVEDITGRIRVRELLEESEERYRRFFENQRDALMTIAPPEWKFTSANTSTLELFGYEFLKDFLTLGPSDVSPEKQPDGSLSSEKARKMIAISMKKGSHFFEWMHARRNGELFPCTVLLTYIEDHSGPLVLATVRDISERKRAEEQIKLSNIEMQAIINSAAEGIRIIDKDRTISLANRTFLSMVEKPEEEVIGKKCYEILNTPLCKTSFCPLQGALRAEKQGDYEIELDVSGKGKKIFYLHTALLSNDYGKPLEVIETIRDVTRHKHLERQIRHSQKMESIGSLAAGIAHEINTPSQFVGDNLQFIKDGWNDFMKLLEIYRKLRPLAEKDPDGKKLIADLTKEESKIDIEFLKEEMPDAINQSLEGTNRISQIVRAMKEFSHPSSKEKVEIDINKAIETAITVARNEWKYVAEMKTDYYPDLPMALCLPNEINQVILNLITNAAHAVGESIKGDGDEKGIIKVITRHDKVEDHVEIKISDTGSGIPASIREKIFDPFFTTKEAGKGTGQGLAISYDIIVNKHGGRIDFDSEEGRGTVFRIRLPVSSGGTE